MCTEGNFIFLVMAKTGLQKQSGSSFVAGASSSFILIGFIQLMFSIYTQNWKKCCS